MPNRSSSLRDRSKPKEYYEECISLLEKYIESFLAKGPVLFSSVSEYYLRICRAAYSAGDSSAKCIRHLERSALYNERYYSEGTRGKLAGLVEMEIYFEGFSGAYLGGRGAEVIAGFRSVLPDGASGWERVLVDQLCGVLTGIPAEPTEAGLLEVKRVKFYSNVPELLKTVTDRDSAAFTEALEAFLVEKWGPSADRSARAALKSEFPMYTGKWNFFSAALCSVMGFVPNLSKKAMEYIPVELVRTTG